MIALRIIIPCIYCILVTVAYSYVSKRKFIDSLAPAFCIQILMMLFSGIVLSSVNIGIVLGIILAIGILLYAVIHGYRKLSQEKSINQNESFSTIICNVMEHDDDIRLEFIYFFLIYFLIFVLNYGKHFNMWDEFSHWGVFIKETLRLDAMYCTSHASMAHKDYVPCITLFEVLWCRLSLRYSEADSYRGIQMLQLSMMLPMIFKTYGLVSSETESEKIPIGKNIPRIICRAIIIIGIPVLFFALEFYHTVYQDLIFGVLVFYCMYQIISQLLSDKNQDEKWSGKVLIGDFEFLLAVTILIMSKMVAMAFLPMILIFYFVWQIAFNKRKSLKTCAITVVLAAVPISIWAYYNKYVSKYLPNIGGGQSYDSAGSYVSKLKAILAHDGTISYQTKVEEVYFKALFTEKIIGVSTYVAIISLVVCGLLLYAFFQKEKFVRNRILLIDLWIFLAAVAYAILMWYLYLTAFGEYEAVKIASYHRYMSTYVLTALLLAAFVVFYYADERVNRKLWIGAVIVIENIVIFTGFKQILPGVITGDRVQYEGETEYITNNVPEGGSVFMITRSDNARLFNGEFTTILNYYCAPRVMTNLSPGTPMSEYDIYSQDISQDELVSRLSGYDYIYFVQFDDYFVEKYSGAFENPDIIEIGKIYPIEEKNGKIAVRE